MVGFRLYRKERLASNKDATYIQPISLVLKYTHCFIRLRHSKCGNPMLDQKEKQESYCVVHTIYCRSICRKLEMFLVHISFESTLKIPAFSPAISPRVFPVISIDNKNTN